MVFDPESGIAGMSNNDALFSQLDEVFAAILSGISPAGRQRTAQRRHDVAPESKPAHRQTGSAGRVEVPDPPSPRCARRPGSVLSGRVKTVACVTGGPLAAAMVAC